MAITLRGTPTTAETSTTVAVVNNVPAGTINGDLLVWVYSDNTTTILATPAGWTLAKSGTGTSEELTIWYRVASSEPASYSTGTTTAGRHVGLMSAYSGVDNVNPFDVAAPTMTVGTTAVACPAITPVTVGAWVLGIAAATVGTGVTNTTYSSANLAAVDAQINSTNGTNVNVVGANGHVAWTSGAFTPTYTTSNATTRTIGATLALRPVERKAIDIHNRRAIVRPTIF